MNHEAMIIIAEQIFNPGVIGLLAIFATPIILGGITAYVSHKETHKITMEIWKYWQNK